MRAARTSARLVGQAVAGELLAIIGSPFIFLANALSFGAAVASLSIIRTGSARPVSPSRKRPQFWAELREGLALINAHAFLRRTVMGDIVWGFFAVVLTTLDVAWVRQVLHQGAIAYAAFWIAQGIGALVGSLVAAGIVARFAVIRIQWLTTAATGALIVVLALVPHLVPDLFIMAAFGIALGVRATVLHTAVQLLVPDEVLGRSMGALGTLEQAGASLGAVATGFAATRLPLALVFGVVGAVIGLASLLWVGVTEPDTRPPLSAGTGG